MRSGTQSISEINYLPIDVGPAPSSARRLGSPHVQDRRCGHGSTDIGLSDEHSKTPSERADTDILNEI